MKKIWSYYIAVFLSAFFLFQIQPMTSKALLPGFGGSYLVWGACMVFYQTILLLGYAHAHIAQRKLGVMRYARFHWLLLILPFLFFPFDLSGLGVSQHKWPLVIEILIILVRIVGLPFLTLATTSLILQRWLAASDLPERENPYVLYGASNLGSILGLLSYPILVEPFVNLKMQGYIWWVGYLLLVIVHAFCFPYKKAENKKEENSVSSDTSSLMIPRLSLLTWFLLSTAACSMLLAVTNVITFDVASVPFLWVLPLIFYLLTFVLTFKRVPWFPEWIQKSLSWAVMLGVLLHLMMQLRLRVPPVVSVVLHILILFIVCMNCSGRLILSKPASVHHLTTFYLVIAAGGLVGSGLVSWLIPLISSSLVEYLLAFLLAVFAVMLSRNNEGEKFFRRHILVSLVLTIVAVVALTLLPWIGGKFLDVTDSNQAVIILMLASLPVALVLLKASERTTEFLVVLVAVFVSMNWTEELAAGATAAQRYRNYYGIYKVYEKDNIRYLQHGTTLHGCQYISGPKRRMPLAYFHPTTPAAQILRSDQFVLGDIGMIGLGTGALATYTRAGQSFTIYELDPDNVPIAEKNFSYLSMARENGCDLDFVIGDGRVALRNEKDNSLDLFMVDAFNSGSIPVHLITVEAIEEYLRVLKDDGLLVMHISNKILDLLPVVSSNARELGVESCAKSNEGHIDPDAQLTLWIAISKDGAVIRKLVDKLQWYRPFDSSSKLPRPWTDQYGNVLKAMF